MGSKEATGPVALGEDHGSIHPRDCPLKPIPVTQGWDRLTRAQPYAAAAWML